MNYVILVNPPRAPHFSIEEAIEVVPTGHTTSVEFRGSQMKLARAEMVFRVADVSSPEDAIRRVMIQAVTLEAQPGVRVLKSRHAPGRANSVKPS